MSALLGLEGTDHGGMDGQYDKVMHGGRLFWDSLCCAYHRKVSIPMKLTDRHNDWLDFFLRLAIVSINCSNACFSIYYFTWIERAMFYKD